jgi:hypothetical protein
MRIAPPDQSIPAYVQPKPVTVAPLSSESSRALIESGIFDQNPNKIVYASAGKAAIALGGPIASAGSVSLANGLRFQPHSTQSDDSVWSVLHDIGEQVLPYLEMGQVPVADGVALLVGAPDDLRALAAPEISTAGKVVIAGAALATILKSANQVLHVPHVDTPLEFVATVFKLGKDVFITVKPPEPLR